jgi:hypothetical protein
MGEVVEFVAGELVPFVNMASRDVGFMIGVDARDGDCGLDLGGKTLVMGGGGPASGKICCARSLTVM